MRLVPGRLGISVLSAQIRGASRSTLRAVSLLLHRPELRRLRWIVLVGVIVRFILAPISSWAIDTPSFVQAEISFLYVGSPYASNLLFNPPLAAYLQLPLYFLVCLFQPPSALLHYNAAVAAVAAATGNAVSTSVPSVPALLALKIPLILADVGSSLLIFLLLRRLGSTVGTATLATGAYLLNPDVIWVSSVHGEVDGIAALFVLLSLFLLLRGNLLASGLALGLSVFAKLFPIFLFPPIIAWVYVTRAPSGNTRPSSRVALFLLGAVTSIIPFLPFLGTIETLYIGGSSPITSGPTSFGGLSFLILFNQGIRTWGPLSGSVLSPASGILLHRALFAGTVFAAVVAGLMVLYAVGPRTSLRRSYEPLFLGALLCAVGSVFSYPSPQSETILAILPLLLLTVPFASDVAWTTYAALSAAAFAFYMALLTPVAYFYPLWTSLGRGATSWANSVALGYFEFAPFPRTLVWVILGVFGGAVVAFLWVYSFVRVLRVPPAEA